MKKAILVVLVALITFGVFAQEVEKIGEIEGLYSEFGFAGGPGSPSEIYVDEKNNLIKIINQSSEFTYFDLNTLQGVKKEPYRSSFSLVQKEFGKYEISFSSMTLRLASDGIEKIYLAGKENISSGISFILKKDDGYIVYYVNDGGSPHAVDTTGKIYSNVEAIEYLKEYDPEKYAESLARAEKLGLKSDFEKANVLIWGQTYYSSVKNMLDFWTRKEEKYLYLDTAAVVQYDAQGNGYQTYFAVSDNYSKIAIVSPNGERLIPPIKIHEASEILKQKYEEDDFMGVSTSWYVGYGGNIYYYIAGDEYTEVFRIRRTWGTPDMYAMAINGYTEDNYGKYVTETLSTMSKSDLRLLRNTIFALYGVHFKSEDLSKHFAKEVWYTDEGKTSGEVELPAHRQKLVEMIQALERK